MIVFSPLALYTTYLGWQQYDVIYDALWQTGLLYVGFIAIVWRFLKNLLAPAGATHHAAEHALNHFLFELAIAVFICGLFVYPSMALQQKGLVFRPVCTLGGEKTKDSSIKDTGTTYDESFADVLTGQVKVPLVFLLLQNVASSTTYGLMKVTGCSDSLQAIKGDLISTHIPQALKKQALDFHQQCYLEAKTAYLNTSRTAAEQAKVQKILQQYGGEDDLNWMGSKVLQTFYYEDLKARSPVPGFSYASNPSSHFEDAGKEDKAVAAHKPEYGYPTCAAWWDKIKEDLVEASNKASWYDEHLGKWNVGHRVTQYKLKHKIGWGSQISADDFIARVLLQDGTDLQLAANEALMDNTNGTFKTAASRALINTGQWFKSFTTTPLKREAILQSLPIMQAFFYFFLIILTPFVLTLSGYSTKAVGSVCALLFMAIFMQYLWHLGSFLERATVNSLGESNVVSAMQNMMVLFYFIAPVILLKLSAHFGGEGGVVLGDLLTSSQGVANEKTQVVQSIGRAGVKAASKGLL
ncbi:membrane protein [Legionella beliardensis]|uniref:Membrane protein n=1 Tax=Legionella beliardensis TaxID=91822 RepID=A0A378JNQ8_9GAMM|nr:conjugal transfer protein TraG N-terminal domain-containing protein [Legionella beliardensis]STX55514.1 membrane protein [Legionella beliardensis]